MARTNAPDSSFTGRSAGTSPMTVHLPPPPGTHDSSIGRNHCKHVPPLLVVGAPRLLAETPSRATQEGREEDEEDGERGVVECRPDALATLALTHGGRVRTEERGYAERARGARGREWAGSYRLRRCIVPRSEDKMGRGEGRGR